MAPSGASLALGISNPGNTLIASSTGSVTVSQGSTELFGQAIELGAFVPKTSIVYHVPWKGTPVEGTYRVKGQLRPRGAPVIAFDRMVTFGGAAIQRFRSDTGKAATANAGTPVALIVALAIAVAVALGFGVAYARPRRQPGR